MRWKHTVTINQAKIQKIEQAKNKALYKTMDTLKTDVVQSQVMPFDTGTMQNNMYVTRPRLQGRSEVSLVTRTTPYAQRLYYHPEYNFQKTNNPHAQGKWLEEYISGSKKDFCLNTFMEMFRRLLP